MMYSVLVKLAMFDTVVDDLRINATASQIRKNTPVVGVFGWKNEFSFRRCERPRCRLHLGQLSENTLHGVQKGDALHLRQIIQRICAADIVRPPAPFAVGNF